MIIPTDEQIRDMIQQQPIAEAAARAFLAAQQNDLDRHVWRVVFKRRCRRDYLDTVWAWVINKL